MQRAGSGNRPDKMTGQAVTVVHLIAKPLPPPPGSGGANRLVDWLARSQHEAGNTVCVMSPNGHSTAYFQSIDTAAETSPEELIRKIPKDTDIVHHHGGFFAHINAINQAGYPVIETVHGNEELPAENRSPANLKTNRVYVSQCHMRLHGGNTFVYNGIPIDEYQLTPTKRDYLLFLAKVRRSKKGVADAIRIAKNTGAPLIIAGGWKFKYPNTWLPLSRNIKSVGRVEGEQKKLLLAEAKALLVPIRWDEPFGLTVVEAMASGTPVIAANRGAMPELIADRETGILCDSIDAMQAAIDQVDKIDALACRDRAANLFSIATARDNYQKLYLRRMSGESW